MDRRPYVLAAVMASTFMIAIEATIVSTAMPQIAGQLGDLRLYAWVFSGFLLTQTATTVVFGKLADVFGRKPVLLVGIALFLLGSVLCGLAWSMASLIAFRLLQGLGAGAIQPIAMTVVGDLYTLEERGRIQGWLASVWGISSVLGPLAGGFIVQHLSWAWVFWVNLPVGAVAVVLLLRYLHEPRRVRTRAVDVPGAILCALAIAALMVAITEAGGDGRLAALSAAAFLLTAGLFAWQERRADDPMLSLPLWSHRPIATANAATFCAGMTLVGLTAFLPMYVQGVMGRSPLVAGFTLTAMVLGWPVAATVAARSVRRFGLRRLLLAGACLLPVGSAAFVLLGAGSSPALAGAGSLVVGLGMGLLSTSAILLIQDVVGRGERGVATASNIFARNLGSTLGATALGGVLNAALGGDAGVSMNEVRTLLERGVDVGGVRVALDGALHLTFWGVLVVAALTLLLALLVPRAATRREDQTGSVSKA